MKKTYNRVVVSKTPLWRSVHDWLRRNFGKASRCEFCNEAKSLYNWALKKGCEYDHKRENFIELCVSCHRKYDFTEDMRQRWSDIRKGRLMTENIKVPITRIDSEGNEEHYDSVLSGANDCGILSSSISNCLKGRSKTAGGYKWKYRDNF